MPERGSADDLSCRELRSILDEEIGSLPEKYRAPIIFCYLEGKNYDQAARELGCPKTSLARWLTKGREMLRKKLERRGITLAAGALATSLAELATASPLPGLLAIKTVKAATLLATGKAVTEGCISAGALALMEEALVGMLWVKGKIVLMVMALGLAVGGVGLAGIGGGGEKSQAVLVEKGQPPPDKYKVQETGKKPLVITDQYGDPLPEGAVARLGALRFRHEGNLSDLAFTPDNKTLVGFSIFSGVHLWDPATGKERHRLPVPRRSMNYGLGNGMGLSPDGTILAVSECEPVEDGIKVSLWDLHSGKKTRTLSLPNQRGANARLNYVCFAPEGKSLALSPTAVGKAVVFDLASGQVRALLGEQGSVVYNPTVSPDSKTLAIAVYPSDSNAVNPIHGVQLWDIATGKLIRTIQDLPLKGFEDGVRAIAFSPRGKMMAFGSMNRIILSDPTTGKELARLEAKKMGQIRDIAFTPDGEKLVSASTFDGKVRVWDVATGMILHTLRGTANQRMALSSDGKTVAVGTPGTSVQLWDVGTGKELFTQFQGGHDSQIVSLAFSPDGKTLVSAGHHEAIFLWNMATGQRKGILPGSAHALSFSPDGRKLAKTMYLNSSGVFSSNVRIWDVTAGKEPLVIKIPNGAIAELATFSPDGRNLYTLDINYRPSSQRVRKWDVATGKQDHVWTVPPPHPGTQALASDGKTVFTAPPSGDISIYEVESGVKRLFRTQDEESSMPMSMTPAPDARVIANGGWGPNSDVRLWEAVTGKTICLLKGNKGSAAATIAWSPDGRLVASGDQRGDPSEPSTAQTVGLWDTATGKELARFGGFKANVTALAFASDGTALAAGLCDSTILVWDTGKIKPKLALSPNLAEDELASHWTGLTADDAGKAHHALWTLVAGPKQSVPFLQGRLKSVAVADPGKIQQWIADLDGEKFAARQTAAKELEKLDFQAMAPIQKALKGNPTLETSRRLEKILNTISDEPGPETVRTIRAIMALERIGSPDAQAVLETLAGGAPGARETEEAKASLERLKHRAANVP